jgi:hypothetical protein
VAWCHWRLADWTVHLRATSDRWYVHHSFATWTVSPLTERSSTNATLHAQHDAAAPHFSRIVTLHLNQQFPNTIGCGGGQKWPPRSPDLNPLDDQVWDYMKTTLCASKTNTGGELLGRILDAARRINNAAVLRKVTRRMITRVGKRTKADRGHFDQPEWVVNYVIVTVQLTTVFNKHTTYFFPSYFIQFTVNTHSSLTVANQTHVHMTFQTQNYLRN